MNYFVKKLKSLFNVFVLYRVNHSMNSLPFPFFLDNWLRDDYIHWSETKYSQKMTMKCLPLIREEEHWHNVPARKRERERERERERDELVIRRILATDVKLLYNVVILHGVNQSSYSSPFPFFFGSRLLDDYIRWSVTKYSKNITKMFVPKKRQIESWYNYRKVTMK